MALWWGWGASELLNIKDSNCINKLRQWLKIHALFINCLFIIIMTFLTIPINNSSSSILEHIMDPNHITKLNKPWRE